jgi:hypothetical protein
MSLVRRDRQARRVGRHPEILRSAQHDTERKKIRDCIRIAPLLRERVLRLAFDCKIPRDAEFI